ncbi:MAG: hypothetical protein CM1200mP15_03100 [Dehalococcoidia bacterium]|nr:MAG: hypothetical protein CM1200mP15_03100 [Dehalococcoidia bacterium]
MDLEPGDELVSVKQLGTRKMLLWSRRQAKIRFPIRNLAPDLVQPVEYEV